MASIKLLFLESWEQMKRSPTWKALIVKQILPVGAIRNV